MYIWKVLHDLYPNPGIIIARLFPNLHEAIINPGISIDHISEHRGTNITYKSYLEEEPTFTNKSILARCCKLYNTLPPTLRRTTTYIDTPKFEDFKQKLDNWLKRIPDQPYIQGKFRPAVTNSIVHQILYIVGR